MLMGVFNGMPFVKATELNRGKASSYIKKVHEDNCDTLVLKNSEPYAVIISVERYEAIQKQNAELEARLHKYEELFAKMKEK